MKLAIAFILAALVILTSIVHGFAAAAPLAFIAAAVLGSQSQLRAGQLGAAPDTHQIASELQLTEFLDAAFKTFKRAMLPLRMFSTVFQNVALKGDGTVTVPYYPLQGVASKDFNGTYSFASGAGSKTDVRKVNVSRAAGGKRKYQPITLTSEEFTQQPRLSIQDLGAMKGERLAYDIVQDILSVVTAANFPQVCFTGAASGFDTDDIIDIRGACNNNSTGPLSVSDGATTNTSTTITSATAVFTSDDIGITISGSGIPADTTIASVTNTTTAVLSAAASATATGVTFTLGRPPIPWPETGRGLLVTPDYDTALMKDSALKNQSASGSTDPLREGMFPRISGFDYGWSPAIPTNGENLVGMAAFKSAILVACAPVPPASQRTIDYRVITDESGLALEYREWFDEDEDRIKKVIEGNYGYGRGEQHALKRMKSA